MIDATTQLGPDQTVMLSVSANNGAGISSNTTLSGAGGTTCSLTNALTTCTTPVPMNDLGQGTYSATFISNVTAATTYSFSATVGGVSLAASPQVNAVPMSLFSVFIGTPSLSSTIQYVQVISGTTTINSGFSNGSGGGIFYVTGGTVTFNTAIVSSPITVGDVFITGGSINHTQATGATAYAINLKASSLQLLGGSIKVDGLGYPANYSYGSMACLRLKLDQHKVGQEVRMGAEVATIPPLVTQTL